MSTPATNPVEKIYLTYKTRMTTEARLRRQSRFYNVMISWYSFWTIVAALVELTGKYALIYSNIVLAAFSIGIFALSLYIGGERFNERAEQFRACYLELQELYNSLDNSDEKMRKYAEILKKYENQQDDDYDNMMFDALLRGQKLENARGRVRITWPVFGWVLLKRACRTLIAVGLSAAPVVSLFYLIAPVSKP